MTQPTQPISPLRQRMIDDMTLRKLSPQTQKAYIRAVRNFTRFFGQSPNAADGHDPTFAQPLKSPSRKFGERCDDRQSGQLR